MVFFCFLCLNLLNTVNDLFPAIDLSFLDEREADECSVVLKRSFVPESDFPNTRFDLKKSWITPVFLFPLVVEKSDTAVDPFVSPKFFISLLKSYNFKFLVEAFCKKTGIFGYFFNSNFSFVNLKFCKAKTIQCLVYSFHNLLNVLIEEVKKFDLKQNCFFVFYCNVEDKAIYVYTSETIVDSKEINVSVNDGDGKKTVIFNFATATRSGLKGFAVCV